MTYELPEPPELKFTLQYNEAVITEYGQACYQAGQADAREDLTIAYMAGYSKGRDSMKAECVKVCEEQYEYYGYDHIFAKKIGEIT